MTAKKQNGDRNNSQNHPQNHNQTMHNSRNPLHGNDVPLGLGMALARNMSAMERFSFLNEAQRRQVLEQAGTVQSRNEMTQLVDSIADGTFFGA